MSPKAGRKAFGKGGSGNAPSRDAVRRFGLLVFGGAFIALFAIVAIAQGLGDPSVPSDNVVLIEEAPGDSGEITDAEFNRALEQAAAQAGIEKVPKPGDDQYDELKDTALNNLFEFVWLQGLADEMGIEVSDQEVASELKKLKDESFKTEAEYKKFLKEAKFTEEDVDDRVRLQTLSTEIQEELKEEVPAPTQEQVENYYEAAKDTQFTQPPSRSVRLILNKDRQKAQRALAALEKGNTAKDWNRVAKKYSEDTATKDNGGLQEGLAEGTLPEPLDAAVFEAPEGQIEGPVKTEGGFYVFEVQNSTPESVQELKEVESQIESQLAQQAEQEYFNSFVSNFNGIWQSRTHCAEDYVTERCANFEDDGHPATAPPACYEANPDGGRPEACPAPVFQLVPAEPGTVSPLEPQGKPMTQRPRPVDQGEGGQEAPTGLPEGVPPPSQAPPSEAPPSEAPPAE